MQLPRWTRGCSWMCTRSQSCSFTSHPLANWWSLRRTVRVAPLTLSCRANPAWCASAALLQLCGRDLTPSFSLAQVSEAQFWSNFHKFVLDQLEGLDWTGVVMAGGAVLACATTQPAKSRYGDKVVLEHLLRYNPSALEHLDSPQDYATFLALHSPDSPTSSSDIDLYLYGFDSEEALLAKQRELAEVIKRNAEARGAEVYATRTRAAVTLFSAFPYRSVQIVIGAKAKCATEVVLDFDLDCCALCFDGTRLLALPRAMLALNRRCNMLRADKNSFVKLATSRLLKYGDRGFATAIAERFCACPQTDDRCLLPLLTQPPFHYAVSHRARSRRRARWHSGRCSRREAAALF